LREIPSKAGYFEVGPGSGVSAKRCVAFSGTKTQTIQKFMTFNSRGFGKFLQVILALAAWTGELRATSLFAPNGSFEAPTTSFASPDTDAWQKSPEPFWWAPTNGPWGQLIGQFRNSPSDAPSHISNMDGQQAAFLFAMPEVYVFQDFNSISGSNTAPTRLFNAQYEAGKSYALTVGVLGGGGGMTNGVTFELSLYYRDTNNNMVTVGVTTITNSAELFPTNTYFTDFQVKVPFVKASDAWAGKRIGIKLASQANFLNQGGYWDIDNVRLTESVLPNYSFESPATGFASPDMDGWQKSPEPFWWSPTNGPWSQLTGQFLNTPNGEPGHISNMEGSQGAFLFALPQVSIFQDYISLGGTNTTPAHDFDATFEAGKSYALTVGVLGNGGGMSNGATLELSLYYRDASSNQVIVAATTITNSAELFPTNTYFTDFQVLVPTVNSNDAWAGKNIGVKIASAIDFSFPAGGYWDLDNVRLTESGVPNRSFESPATSFASPDMDGWQKAPEPFWWSPTNGPWGQLIGQFLNTPKDEPGHISNMEGSQGAFLFALPQVYIFQDYNSLSGTNTMPSHGFAAVYEPGRSYNLTVGVLGNGGGMSNGATLELSLYYLDAGSNMVTVAATIITNSADLFPTNTYFTDFEVIVPPVTGHEPWAGKHIGIKIASAIDFSFPAGGYWDLDNVRLQAVRDPLLKDLGASGEQFTFTLDSAPGQLEILTSTDVTLPTSAWTSLGAVTNLTGALPVTVTNAVAGQRFYRARQIP
jgi:fumarate reductase subunit C